MEKVKKDKKGEKGIRKGRWKVIEIEKKKNSKNRLSKFCSK